MANVLTFTASEFLRVKELLEQHGSLTREQLSELEAKIESWILPEMYAAGWLSREGKGIRGKPFLYKLR